MYFLILLTCLVKFLLKLILLQSNFILYFSIAWLYPMSGLNESTSKSLGPSHFSLYLDVTFNFLNCVYTLRRTENANAWPSEKSVSLAFPPPQLRVPALPARAGLRQGDSHLGHISPSDSASLHLHARQGIALITWAIIPPWGDALCTRLFSFGYRNSLCLWLLSLYTQRKNHLKQTYLTCKVRQKIPHTKRLEVVID